MICIGARFDDRITGRLDAFSPGSKKIHVDIDPSSINKNVKVDVPIIGDCAHVLEDMVRLWRDSSAATDQTALAEWWKQIDKWRARKSLAYKNSNEIIKPQYAIQRLYELTKDRDVYITTEVGQHQMWAAQFFRFEEPNRWMTSGGLGTMGYGLPAAVGVQLAHPNALVIDIAGEASVLMNMQEMSTAAQYRLPIKIFIINNQYMGMVRQWQELLHGGRYAHSYTEALPDFVKLAEAYHAVGIRCERPGDLDDAIREMINVRQAGDLRLRGRSERELLPDDPVGPRPQRDAPGRRGREPGGRHHRGRQGDGVKAPEPVESRTLSVLVDNEPGVLARVIGLFSGRGYNIDSLTVSETEHEKHLSRITIVTRGTPMVIEQIKNQLERLVPVHRVVDLTAARPSIQRELAMVKVRGKSDQRVEALRLADAFRAHVIDATHRELRVRDHRQQRQDRAVHLADAAARPGRGLAHRHRRHRPRAGGDVSAALPRRVRPSRSGASQAM